MKTNKEIIDEFNSNIMLRILSSEANAYLTTITFGKREFYTYSNTLIEQALKTVEERTAKAYGACELCFGKGYSTVRYGLYGAGDFIGDKGMKTEPKTNIHCCSCDRGKQLKELIS